MSQKASYPDTTPSTPPQPEQRSVARIDVLIVERRDNESAERLLERFQRVIQRSGVLRDAKRKRHFTSKSEERRMARSRAIRKLRKNAAKAQARLKDRPYGARNK